MMSTPQSPLQFRDAVYAAVPATPDAEAMTILITSIEVGDLAARLNSAAMASAREIGISQISPASLLITDDCETLRTWLATAGAFAQPAVVSIQQIERLLSRRTPWSNGERSRSQNSPDLQIRLDQLQSKCNAAIHSIRKLDSVTLGRVARWCESASWEVAPLLQLVAEDQRMARMSGALTADKPMLENRFGSYRRSSEPLEMADETTPLDVDQISAVFSEDGLLAGIMPVFEERTGQIDMAAAVAEAFNLDDRLLIEAGTGTGKGLAYLVPAALHALAHGSPVVVSTHTLALQDQLRDSDVVMLREALADTPGIESLRVSTVKGRSNYLCLQDWQSGSRTPPADEVESRTRSRIVFWLNETATGDRAELALDGDEGRVFGQFSADTNTCVPAKCQFYQRNQCFLFKARREAESAHLILANHALLLSGTDEFGGILPPFAHLVVDEAHHLEEQATNQFGFRLRHREFDDLVGYFAHYEGTSIGGLIGDAVRWLTQAAAAEDATAQARFDRANQAMLRSVALRQKWGDFLGLVATFVQPGNRGREPETRVTTGMRTTRAWENLEVSWENLDNQIGTLYLDALWFRDQLNACKPPEQLKQAIDDCAAQLQVWMRDAEEFRSRLRMFAAEPQDNAVYWISWPVRQQVPTLASAPLRVGDLLKSRLYGQLQSLVLTSATLSAAGSFEYLATSLGLEDANTRTVASPFDFERSTMVYIAEDVPEPGARGYEEAVAEAIRELSVALQGRSLALFTSYATLRAVDEMVRPSLAEAGIRVLAQGADGSPQQLIESLRANDRVTVLGAATMWEGIDVPGEALSALAVVRLPFPVPSDPVFQARGELYDNSFSELSLPQAVLRFRQGFGRLIRRRSDRGICLVLDRRVITKSYGRQFLQSLPGYTLRRGPTSRLPADATEWLAQKGE